MLSYEDNDTLTYFFWLIFNPPLLDHHITSLEKIKIDDLRVMKVMG